MEPQSEHPSSTPKHEPKRVFVDIYHWVHKARKVFPRMPMEGMLRHAVKLCQEFTPAIFLDGDEQITDGEIILAIEKWVGKPVAYFRGVESMKGTVDVWVSLAVNLPAPFIDRDETPFLKVAILHDILAGQGVFGPEQEADFRRGAVGNDAFLYVSVTSLHRFGKWLNTRGVKKTPTYIKYGCFHDYAYMHSEDRTRNHTVLAVHMLQKRKNHVEEIAVAGSLGMNFLHIGGNLDVPENEIVNSEHVHFAGLMGEESLTEEYRSAYYFVCMSEDEGFSMGPMEAILMGVPIVILSDIPVHREIYGDLDVNFVELGKGYGYHPKETRTVSAHDRALLFNTYTFEKVIRPFREYLAAI